jgi:prepilin-type N-terminal cleavage/methylation domain-containing protein
MKNRAFTLLELLVVITIIGILSSIVIVSMSGSTDSATIAKGKAYAQQVHALLGSNAVGVWNFDEGTVNTCSATQDVCDISGYNNHGTFVGDTHFVDSDIEGYALSFDGTGDYVDLGTDKILNIQGPLTISAWMNPSSGMIYSAYYTILVKNSIYSSGYGLEIYGSVNRIEFWTRGDTIKYASRYEYGSLDNIIGNWYFLVGVYDGINNYLYVNGIVTGPGLTGIAPGDTSDIALRIGKEGNAYFHGLIDEVRIYSEALPATEIQRHYVQGLEKLLANQAITQLEYDQRMEEFNQYLASNNF